MNDVASRDMSSIDARGLKKIRDKRNIFFIWLSITPMFEKFFNFLEL